jgi:hypothetical protein
MLSIYLKDRLQKAYNDTVNGFDNTSLNQAYHSALKIQQQSAESNERINYQLLLALIRKFVSLVPSDTVMSDSVNTLKTKYTDVFNDLKQRVNNIDDSISFYNADEHAEDNRYFYQPNSNEYVGSQNVFVKSIGSKPDQKNKIVFYCNLLLMVDTEKSVQDTPGIVETITNCIMKLRPSTDTQSDKRDSAHIAQSAYISMYNEDSTSVGKIESIHICQKNGIPYVFVIQQIQGNTFRSVAKYIHDLYENPEAEDHKDSLQTINKMLLEFINKNCAKEGIMIQNPQPEDFYVCINSNHEIKHLTFVNPYKVHSIEHRPSPTDDMLQSITSMMKKANVSTLRYQLSAVAYQLSKSSFLEELFPSGTQENEKNPMTNNANTETPIETDFIPDANNAMEDITTNHNVVNNVAMDGEEDQTFFNNEEPAEKDEDTGTNDEPVEPQELKEDASELNKPVNNVLADANSVEESPDANSVESPVENSVEESPDANSVEESPDANSVEESPDANSVESPVENSVEESPVENSVEESPDANSVESPVENSVEESPVENSVEESPDANSVEESPDANSVNVTNSVNKSSQSGGRHTQKHLPSTSRQTMKLLKPSSVITHSIKANGGNISTARTHRNQQSKLDRTIHMLRRQLLKRLKQKKTLAKEQ